MSKSNYVVFRGEIAKHLDIDGKWIDMPEIHSVFDSLVFNDMGDRVEFVATNNFEFNSTLELARVYVAEDSNG